MGKTIEVKQPTKKEQNAATLKKINKKKRQEEDRIKKEKE